MGVIERKAGKNKKRKDKGASEMCKKKTKKRTNDHETRHVRTTAQTGARARTYTGANAHMNTNNTPKQKKTYTNYKYIKVKNRKIQQSITGNS